MKNPQKYHISQGRTNIKLMQLVVGPQFMNLLHLQVAPCTRIKIRSSGFT